mmetsp:Transcript_10778/g.16073  ORF Transcript_10778/g.16073 Transcript_10778/m.16073 type:complete len:364 (+) Transcript_10778:78-1169(+)
MSLRPSNPSLSSHMTDSNTCATLSNPSSRHHAELSHDSGEKTASLKASKNAEDINAGKGYVFMVLLALQYGLQPLIQKSFIDRFAVNKVSLVLATEVTKILICSSALIFNGSLPEIWKHWSLFSSIKAALLPATCYAFQNWLTQIAYMNLDSLTFILLNQLKTLSAGVCLFIVMGTRQSNLQILALIMLLAAAILLNFRNDQNMGPETVSWEYGIVPVLAASFLSGFSAAVTQRSLQSKGRNSFLLSAELGFYGIIVVVVTTLTSESGHEMLEVGLWKGWTRWTFIPVFTQSLGGLFVGQVTKHAGSVKKGFALMVGILVTALAQYVLERQPLSPEHYASGVLVAFSMFLHTRYPYVYKKKTV